MSYRNDTLCGTIESMVFHIFTIVYTMTCVEDDKVHGVILVIGGSTYGWLITHHESPLNIHYHIYDGNSTVTHDV